MRISTVAIMALALAGCSKATKNTVDTTTTVTNEGKASTTNVVSANMTNASAPAAALTSLNETTWEFKGKDGKELQDSVDATGKYITVSGKEHIDHGTAVMKGGKICETSLMNKDGEVCWTDPMIAIGGSGQTTSDKGEKLAIKRVAYVPHTM